MMEKLVRESLSPSEALYGLGGWLTTRDEPITLSGHHNAAGMADLIAKFIEKQDLDDPIEHWEDELIPMDEGFVGRTRMGYEIYKNPKNIENFSEWTRALSTKSGNLYIADDYELIHTDFEKYLKGIELLSKNIGWQKIDRWKVNDNYCYVGLVAWQRKGDTNHFYLSESYPINLVKNDKKIRNEIKAFISKVRKKNPQFKFHFAKVPDNMY